jgi:hypothetical protein
VSFWGDEDEAEGGLEACTEEACEVEEACTEEEEEEEEEEAEEEEEVLSPVPSSLSTGWARDVIVISREPFLGRVALLGWGRACRMCVQRRTCALQPASIVRGGRFSFCLRTVVYRPRPRSVPAGETKSTRY